MSFVFRFWQCLRKDRKFATSQLGRRMRKARRRLAVEELEHRLVPALPAGWSAVDIGGPPLAGSSAFNGTTWTVQGNGRDIANTADQFQYAYSAVSGDATLIARVTALSNTGAWAKAGVMFRDGTGSGAPFVDVVTHPSLTVEMDWRNSAGTASNWTGSVVGDTVNLKWVKLARSGNTFSGYYATTSGMPASSDWVLIGTDTLAMTAPTAGLAVCSDNVNALATATFTGVGLALSNAPPAAPSNLTAVASGGQVSLSWQSNSTNQTGFKVERANDSGFTQGLTLLTTTAATVTTYTDTTVTVGNTYYYRVRATNSFGDSPNSNTASATVTNTPAAPSNLTAVGGGQISLSWQSNSTNQTGFKVERATDSGFTQNLTLVTTTAANATSYADTTLYPSVTYYYRVRATNAFGDSANSNTASAAILQGGWAALMVGSPASAGSTAFDPSTWTWTVSEKGPDIATPPDQFQYTYQPVSGDATIVVHVASLQNTGAWAKAGAMFRDGTDPSAAYVAVFMHPSLTVEMEWRNSAGTASNWNGSVQGDTTTPKWLKLVRSGNTFSAYYASTIGMPENLDSGSNWVLIATDTCAMTAPTVGLVVTADNPTATCTATFNNVTLTAASAAAVTVAATTQNVPESGGGPGVFTVTRQGPTTAPLTVYYTMGGSAVAGANYAALPGSVTIPAGAASATITVTPQDDGVVHASTPSASLFLLSNANYTATYPGGVATVFIADNDAPNAALPVTRFAQIGDYGSNSPAEQAVADLVHSWNPAFITTTGDNNYNFGSAGTIDANVGKYYHDYIAPYSGSYGAGAAVNAFYPSLGFHDWGSAFPNATGVQPYLNYFSGLPGNQRYYDVSLGLVHLFVLDSDNNEPDGNTSSSVQAQWLQSRLAAATEPYKIVIEHNPPYTSGYPGNGGFTNMQWPFQAWGATAVLSGKSHDYERLAENSNFPYLIDGLGGEEITPWNTTVSGSNVRYNGNYGAMLVEATAANITFQFVTVTGQVIDSYTINNPQA